MEYIDIDFDFTMDTPQYWQNYWENNSLLDGSNVDPDNKSKTMQLYHKLLYSKPLPNGEILNLQIGNGANYLTWKNFRFGSDSITTSFRYKNYRQMIERVANTLPNYRQYMENYLHKSYTLGGEIIFPKRKGGINQTRGCNSFIKDRWDLTLECIRKFYRNEESPLFYVLQQNKDFFDLFIDFKGYVNFFYLQDCVTEDYSHVKFWIGNGNFEPYPLPKTVNEYITWIEKELEFIELRNKRIFEDIENRKIAK